MHLSPTLTINGKQLRAADVGYFAASRMVPAGGKGLNRGPALRRSVGLLLFIEDYAV